jgi:hypothetical protein
MRRLLGGTVQHSLSLDAIRVRRIQLVRTVGPSGKVMAWVPSEPRPVFGPAVLLHPEPASFFEQQLLTFSSLLGICVAAGYAASRIAGW